MGARKKVRFSLEMKVGGEVRDLEGRKAVMRRYVCYWKAWRKRICATIMEPQNLNGSLKNLDGFGRSPFMELRKLLKDICSLKRLFIRDKGKQLLHQEIGRAHV